MRPDGRLVVLSYPAFLPNPDDSADAQPSGRCPEVWATMSADERRAVYQAAVQLRDMVANAVAATGDPNVVFVDLLEAFRGQRVCSATPMANDVKQTIAEIERRVPQAQRARKGRQDRRDPWGRPVPPERRVPRGRRASPD